VLGHETARVRPNESMPRPHCQLPLSYYFRESLLLRKEFRLPQTELQAAKGRVAATELPLGLWALPALRRRHASCLETSTLTH
jgi:hypothetical protein